MSLLPCLLSEETSAIIANFISVDTLRCYQGAKSHAWDNSFYYKLLLLDFNSIFLYNSKQHIFSPQHCCEVSWPKSFLGLRHSRIHIVSRLGS